MMLKKGVYIITGLMASGKSTIAQMLAEQFDQGVHVRGDIFRKMIVTGGIDMAPESPQAAVEQLRLRYHIAAKVADMYYKSGFAVVLQDVYLGKEVYSFLDLFEAKPLYFITLNPKIDVLLKREKKRSKTGYIIWEVEALENIMKNENPRIGLWIDSSDLTPEETLNDIIKRAESEARLV
ncbi:AAA family ATPase [Bacillus sonorensis]|nr:MULTISPECIES: AAA family ATPase [Bacillus]TWK84241.1 Cytidylate kinase [Bacillus paralicheniformis]MCZ0075086.1 AAA family ATPase [Bacillus sonorensis]MCZ0093226.1 AAA family ATPase [Bacillus sonorensis]MDR4958300.1 AAA family ATPase [Bacillus sonorensis]MEC0338532.1 AAA family ATPase [Bacillus sonorensis]